MKSQKFLSGSFFCQDVNADLNELHVHVCLVTISRLAITLPPFNMNTFVLFIQKRYPIYCFWLQETIDNFGGFSPRLFPCFGGVISPSYRYCQEPLCTCQTNVMQPWTSGYFFLRTNLNQSWEKQTFKKTVFTNQISCLDSLGKGRKQQKLQVWEIKDWCAISPISLPALKNTHTKNTSMQWDNVGITW